MVNPFLFHFKITGMRVSTRNTAQTVLKLFLETIKEYGCPYRVRGDRGSENVDLCTWMIMYRGPNRASFMWGTYVLCTVGNISTFSSKIGLPITPGLKGFGLRAGGTLHVAGGPFSIALNGCTSSIGTTHITFGSCTRSSLRTFSTIVKGFAMIGIVTLYLERAKT
jgi:hypothetical protein